MEISKREIIMRKLRTKDSKEYDILNSNVLNVEKDKKIPFFMKDESKTIRILLLLSWIFPFYSLFFIYLARTALPERAKTMTCKILNMSFTVILVEFILVSSLQVLAFSRVPGIIIYTLIIIISGIFFWSVLSHLAATVKWLNNKDFSYRLAADFFKPWDING